MRDYSTSKIAAADLRGLLNATTPPDRQCPTAEMPPLVAEQLHAAPEVDDDDLAVVVEPIASIGLIPLPWHLLPDRPERMSNARTLLAPLDAQITVSAPSVVMRRPKSVASPRG